MNEQERLGKTYSVVETGMKELTVKGINNQHNKTYQFDRVFGPKSEQIHVYRSVVEPLLEEVMMGYNCTVFAYGQTGSGKTFTMEGKLANKDKAVAWDVDPIAGIVPRALGQMFDKLNSAEQGEETESVVKVSFLELYNEEMYDLLSAAEDMNKLKLFEDPMVRGSVIIHGLEDVIVTSKEQVMGILEKGSMKRQTAETMMNASSSRSHTVFTITVHIKEVTKDGDEVLRTGKLNLVDLAGSENIGRSGAQDQRAVEAGKINQSLLTLGRVITSLVEHAGHVPYRESKLTRLLQDSLGGRTKTSIIATVSPAAVNYEETVSTLDYANRAKNITNRPEINQRLNKAEMLKSYETELTKLKRDWKQVNDTNGVYLAKDNWLKHLSTISENEVKLNDLRNQIAETGCAKEEKEKMFEDMVKAMISKSREVEKAKTKLALKEEKLDKVKEVLVKVVEEREEQEELVSSYKEVEGKLGIQARKLMVACSENTQDLEKLHTKKDALANIEARNVEMKEEFRGDFSKAVEEVSGSVEEWKAVQVDGLTKVGKKVEEELAKRQAVLERLAGTVEDLSKVMKQGIDGETTGLAEISNAINEANIGIGSAIKEGEEKMVKVGDGAKVNMEELVTTLAKVVNQQSEELVGLNSKVKADLDHLVNSASDKMASTVQRLSKLDRAVQDVSKKAELNNVEVSSASADIADSHGKLLSAVQHLQAAYADHEEATASAMARILPLSTEMETSSITNEVDVLIKLEETQMNKVKLEEAEVNKSLKGLVGRALDSGKAQMGKSKKLGEVAAKLNMESEVVLVEVLKEVKKVESNNAKQVSFIKKSGDGKILNTRENLKTINSEEVLKKNQDVNADKENTKGILTAIAHVEEKITSGKEEGKAGVAKVEALATSLLEEKLQEYQSKGDTPVRKQNNFPRTLIQPVKKELLVEEVRRRREERKERERLLREEEDAAILKMAQEEVVKVEEHNQSADSGVVSAASARPSFGVDSVADNKENMTKMEEHTTPSKKGGLGERRRQFGSSKHINAITK